MANNFTLDYSHGSFLVPGGITFDGGALPATPSNALTIIGGNFDTDTYDFTDAHDGSIQLGTNGQVVNYTNLTPLSNTGTADNVALNLPGGTVVATLDAGPIAGTIELVSGNSTFETTTIAAPSGSLTVNAGNGSDTVNATNGFYNNFGGNITVNGAANTLPVHAVAAGALTTTEGASLSATLATFRDPNGSGAPIDYSATIDWGDGSSTVPGAISGPDVNGVFTVTGTYTYAEATATPDTLTVEVHRANAVDATVLDSVAVADAPLTGSNAATAGGTEGATLSSVLSGATFSDANRGDHSADMTATITWGDNGPTSQGTVSYNNGVYTVSGSHTYAEEGSWPISIVVSDGGLAGTTITGNAQVADAPLSSLPIDLTPPPATAGQTFGPVTVFRFQDADPAGTSSDYTAIVNTGDATLSSTANPQSVTIVPGTLCGGFDVQLTYTYAAELSNRTFSVAVSDHNSSTSQSLSTFSVAGSGALMLDATASGALSMSGNAKLSETGPITVDSNSFSAVDVSGNAQATASSISVFGGVRQSGRASLQPQASEIGMPVADSLAGLDVPSPGSSPVAEILSGNSVAAIGPGTYSQITVSGNAHLTLAPGVYVISSGGLNVSGNAAVTGSGVMICNEGGAVNLSGNSLVTLTSPAYTAAYGGIGIFQPGGDTLPLLLTGHAALGLGGGTIYAPSATLELGGIARLSATLIVDTLSLNGNAVVNDVAATQPASGTPPAAVAGTPNVFSVPTSSTSGATTAAVDAVFAAYAFPEDDDTLG